MRKHLLDCVWLWQIYTAAQELQWREAEKLLTEAENRNTVSALNHTEIKILWLLANVLVREELTFKCCSLREQLLIPKSPKTPFSHTTSKEKKRNAPTHPNPCLSSSLERNTRKKKPTEETCVEQTVVLLKAAVHCELWCSSASFKPGLTVALGRRRSFLCILMRHHEGLLRVKISGRLATYSTALGGITNTAALLISYRERH